MLAAGGDIETILEGYAWMEREDVLALGEYARRVVAHERVAHREGALDARVVLGEMLGVLEALAVVHGAGRWREARGALSCRRSRRFG